MKAALAAAAPGRGGKGSSVGLSLLVALLPKCPLCIGAHAGVLGAMGIGQGAQAAAWMRPLVVVSVLAVLALLARRVRMRGGAGPLVVAAIGGALVLLEIFHEHAPAHAHHGGGDAHSAVLTWSGVALLFAGSLWNAWPRAAAAPSHCATHAGGAAHPVSGG